MIASLLAFVGCQNEELVNDNNTDNSGKKVILTANIQGAADSRVVLTPETSNGATTVKVEWNRSGEKFKVYDCTDEEYSYYGEPAWFTQIEGTNLFEGTLPESVNGTYLAVYGDDFSSPYTPLQYSLHEQDGTLYQENANIHKSSVLMFAEFTDDNPTITFQHQTAILKPTFMVDDDDIDNTITGIVMENVCVPATNVSRNDIAIKPAGNNATLDDDIYIHLPMTNMSYFDYEDGQYPGNHKFIFVVIAGTTEYIGSLTIPDDKSIVAGNFYTATIELTEVVSANYVWKSGIAPSTSVEGNGTKVSPYRIATANDLQWMINQVNNAAPQPSPIDESENTTPQLPYYRLTHDLKIDSEEGATWTPIGTEESPFVGYFDGGGHTISGEMVTASDVVDAGFFGYVGVGTVITNLTNAANVTSLAHNLEKCYVGGIVGFAIGYDAASSQYNSTYIIACHNTGTITNGTGMTVYSATGGIAGGIFNGTCVLACSNTGNLVGNDPNNDILVGGIVGLGECNYTKPSIVSCWTGKGVIVGGDYGVILDHNGIELNYSTDSNYSGESFYIPAITEVEVNGRGGLNYYIYAFNGWNSDYTGRTISCNWHWELTNGSVVLVAGKPT